MAELQRNQRREIGCQHVKVHSCSHFSPCFDHTSPTKTDDGTSQLDHDTGAYVPTLSEQCHGFFYVPFQLKYKDEGDKANGLTSPPNDAIIWTEKGFSQLAWSHQFFKDLGWWSGQGLNSRPPTQQTGALSTELTGWASRGLTPREPLIICTKRFATGSPVLSPVGWGVTVGSETSDEASHQGTSWLK